MTALLARLARATRVIPGSGPGPVAATVVSALVALGIAGPLVYRALDEAGGGGDAPTAAAPEPDQRAGGNDDGNRNGDGDEPEVALPAPDEGGAGDGGGGDGSGGASDAVTSATSVDGPSPSAAEQPAAPPPTSPPTTPPTTTPPTTTPPTTNPPPEPEPVLLLSKEPTRDNAIPIEDTTVGGFIYVFVEDANQATDAVAFFVDDEPVRTDSTPDFDLCGTTPTGDAEPFNTKGLLNGWHSITARVTGAEPDEPITVTAKIEVKNLFPDPPPRDCGAPPVPE
jgi:hypothetical protein